jgi:hypothetical protein
LAICFALSGEPPNAGADGAAEHRYAHNRDQGVKAEHIWTIAQSVLPDAAFSARRCRLLERIREVSDQGANRYPGKGKRAAVLGFGA